MGRHGRRRHGRPRRGGLLALRLSLAALTVAGASVAGVAWTGDGAAPPPPTPAVPAPAGPAVRLAGAPAAPAPTRVRVPSAGVDSALAALGVDRSGALQPPSDTVVAGWFAQGTAPGSVGPAVIAGHVDSTRGPGVFFRLRDVVRGDAVLVDRADGRTLRFAVTRVARYPKTAFPTGEVYGATPDAELRLITCGGRFDRAQRSYEEDVVVFARLAGP